MFHTISSALIVDTFLAYYSYYGVFTTTSGETVCHGALLNDRNSHKTC